MMATVGKIWVTVFAIRHDRELAAEEFGTGFGVNIDRHRRNETLGPVAGNAGKSHEASLSPGCHSWTDDALSPGQVDGMRRNQKATAKPIWDWLPTNPERIQQGSRPATS
jgi:hypothetical protein